MDDDKDSYEFAPPGPGLLQHNKASASASLLVSNSRRGLRGDDLATSLMDSSTQLNQVLDDSELQMNDDSSQTNHKALEQLENNLDDAETETYVRSGR